MTSRDRLLTIQEAADLLGMSKATLRRWTKAGILDCERVNERGDRRFDKRCLEAVVPPKRTGRPRTRNVTE